MTDLSDYVRQRAQLEASYTQKLRQLYTTFNEKRQLSAQHHHHHSPTAPSSPPGTSMSSTMLAERAFPSIRGLWDTLLGRLRTDCITHDQHAQEYLQIVLPRLAQSNEFTQRVGRRGAEIGAKYQTELEDQMKRLDRTLKYYLKSRQSKDR